MIRGENEYEISCTQDSSQIAICAGMMAGSDPWIRLEMDYAHCLKSFDGPCKEIYMLELEKKNSRVHDYPGLWHFFGLYSNTLYR